MTIEKTTLFVITTNVNNDDMLVAREVFERDFPEPALIDLSIVLREELHLQRPLLDVREAMMVRWEPIRSLKGDMVMWVYHELAKQGYLHFGQTDNIGLVTPGDKKARAKAVTSVIPGAVLKQDMHQILRLPIYEKVAPVEPPEKMVLPAKTVDNDWLDGILAVYDGPTCQVRVTEDPDHWADPCGVRQKGLMMKSLSSRTFRVKKAEFGVDLPREVTVYVIARYRQMGASHNLLSILANRADPVQFIEEENRRLAHANINQFLSHQTQTLVGLGAPIGALMYETQLFKLVERFPIDRKVGGTFLCLPDYTGVVPVGSFALGKGSQYKPRTYTQLVHRNPGLFRVTEAEIRFWGYMERGEPFAAYLNPSDPILSRLAADFDGDFITIKDKEDHEELARALEHETKYLAKPKKLDTNDVDVLLARQLKGPSQKVGMITLAAMRLAVLELMDSEMRIVSSDLCQGSTYAKKKAVLEERHAKDTNDFIRTVFDLVSEQGTVIDGINGFKHESDKRAKRAKFDALRNHEPSTRTEEVIVQRAGIVAVHAKAVQILAAWVNQWPEAVKTHASADMFAAQKREDNPLTQEMIAQASSLGNQFRRLAAQTANNEEAKSAKKRAFEVVREAVAKGVEAGWPQGLLIDVLPPSLAVDFIDPEWLAGANIRQRFSYLVLKEEVKNGEYDVSEVPSSDVRFANFVEGASSIELKHVEGKVYLARAIIDENVGIDIDEGSDEFLCD